MRQVEVNITPADPITPHYTLHGLTPMEYLNEAQADKVA